MPLTIRKCKSLNKHFWFKHDVYHANVDANLMVRNVTQIKSGIMINVGVALEIRKKIYNVCKKDYICNSATCSCKNGKYDRVITDNSVTLCDEIKTGQKQF